MTTGIVGSKSLKAMKAACWRPSCCDGRANVVRSRRTLRVARGVWRRRGCHIQRWRTLTDALHRDLLATREPARANWSPPASTPCTRPGGPVARHRSAGAGRGLDFDKMKQEFGSWLSSNNRPAQRQIDLFRMGFARARAEGLHSLVVDLEPVPEGRHESRDGDGQSASIGSG